ncbi:MAG: ComEC/Rec2 family competence protein [Candidatus Egerieousia sp.]|nr:ComEC/Rec2 family competence protein [bacterium]MDY5256191.1 ComEC/Rec2 family competence protein [Candidatus Egerieousia sp.]
MWERVYIYLLAYICGAAAATALIGADLGLSARCARTLFASLAVCSFIATTHFYLALKGLYDAPKRLSAAPKIFYAAPKRFYAASNWLQPPLRAPGSYARYSRLFIASALISLSLLGALRSAESLAATTESLAAGRAESAGKAQSAANAKSAGQRHSGMTPMQQRIALYLKSKMGDNSQSAILTAFVTGSKESIGKSTKETFRSSGAAHLLALSGLHVGILFMILNRITALFSLTLAARRMRVLVVVGCTAAFLAITGFIPSLARAIIMAAICSIAKVWGYRIARAETLVITAFLLICYNPQVVASIGFQLSFAAMAGIMLIMPTLSESLESVMGRWRGRGMASRTICWCAERIAAPLLLTISCQITTLPLCLYYFQSFSNYYLITNLIAIPVVAITLYMLTAALAIDALALIIQSDLLTSLSVFVWESIRYILLLLESTLKEFR